MRQEVEKAQHWQFVEDWLWKLGVLSDDSPGKSWENHGNYMELWGLNDFNGIFELSLIANIYIYIYVYIYIYILINIC